MWSASRDEAGFQPRVPVLQKYGRGLAAEVKAMSHRYEDIFIDAGGRSNDEMAGALAVANIAIIPFQPSQFDLWTMRRMSELVEKARLFNTELDARVLINKASTNPAIRDEEGVAEMLEEFPNLKVFEFIIRDRSSIRRTGIGMSVDEYEPVDAKAKAEFNAIYQDVFAAKKIHLDHNEVTAHG
jgi:chromosome partitioning protein